MTRKPTVKIKRGSEKPPGTSTNPVESDVICVCGKKVTVSKIQAHFKAKHPDRVARPTKVIPNPKKKTRSKR
jgi:hypothetical protein